MTDNTDEQAIGGLLAQITPGPWEYTGHDMDLFRYTVGDENAAFIVAAPGAVAFLLAEVDRLRGELAAVRELHKPETITFYGKDVAQCAADKFTWPCATDRALGAS